VTKERLQTNAVNFKLYNYTIQYYECYATVVTGYISAMFTDHT